MNTKQKQKPPKNIYKNFIFDCFGVLVTWDRALKISLDTTSHTGKDHFHLMTLLQHPYLKAAEKGLMTQEDAFLKVCEEHNVPYELFKKMVENTEKSLVEVPQCIDLIDKLRKLGKKVYCLTNMTENAFHHLSNHYNFWNKFDDIFVSAHVKMRKPEPEIFHHVLKIHNLNPAETAFIDDEPENIEVAQSLGITAILFSNIEEGLKQLKATCLVGIH